MKAKLLVVSATALLLACNAISQSSTTTSGSGQAGAGASAGADASAGVQQQQTIQQQQPAPGQQPPPGLEQRDTLPPGLQKRDELPPGLSKRDWGTNQFGGPSVTNETSISPTGATNQSRIFGSAGATSGANASVTSTTTIYPGDHFATDTDRTLLVNIRNEVNTIINQIINSPGASIGGSAQTGVTAPAGTAGQASFMPVHFAVNRGVVRLIGVVPSTQERVRIESSVRRVPGVTRVVNELRVNANANANVQTSLDGVQTALPGVNVSGAQSGTAGTAGVAGGAAVAVNTNSFAPTNLPPTGRTNGLPPGLQNREQLPPGLERREQLPPGLSRQTNSPRANP